MIIFEKLFPNPDKFSTKSCQFFFQDNPDLKIKCLEYIKNHLHESNDNIKNNSTKTNIFWFLLIIIFSVIFLTIFYKERQS